LAAGHDSDADFCRALGLNDKIAASEHSTSRELLGLMERELTALEPAVP
jgi:hypothetical protein